MNPLLVTPSLHQAVQHKNSLPFPTSVRKAKSGYQVVTKLQTMTQQQRDGLEMAYEWHQAFNRINDDVTFNPIQFEIHGISTKSKAPALANELRQLGLLQCHNGRYWISPAGLSLVKLLNSESTEY